MQNQDLLLLQILKFPVIIIKFLARILSILTYLPNYAILFLIDSVLFRQHLNSTLLLYILTWLPKVVLLGLALGIFVGEFYLIFEIMQLHDHGLIIQIFGIILTLAGLLILMRKGYLSMLTKYNLTKLKSPMEHVQLGLIYLTDLVGIFLWIINVALIINIGRSWDYQYDPSKNHQFIKHIFNLIRESMISYIQFFYVKIFFRIFPWRFIRQLHTYKKQKEEKNVLNCLVLLTLIYLSTLLDIIVVLLFGLFCIIHPQRKKYYKDMKQNHEKYKITMKQFAFVLLHSVQLCILLFCTLLCWKNGAKALKEWNKQEKASQLFNQKFRDLIIEAILKIPYILSTTIIFLSIYKYKRRRYVLIEKQGQKIDIQKQDDSDIPYWVSFICLGQLIWDLCFLIFILISTIVKPWNIWWIRLLINDQYVMNHNLILAYFLKNMQQMITLPFALITTFLIFLYELSKPYQLYKEAAAEVYKQYHQVSDADGAAPDQLKHKKYVLSGKSQLSRYFLKSCQSLKSDLPHLPLLFIVKMTLLNVYYPEIKPQTTPSLYIMFQRSYFYLTAKRSPRFNEYKQMFQRIKASGGLTNIKEQYRFWKFAYKSERFILIQKIMTMLLPKKSVERIKQKIEKGTEFSEISNYYWYQYDLAWAMIIRFIYLVIEAILTLIGVLFLFPLTLWRIPTFVKLFLYHKSRKFFFPILSRIYVQMARDVITLPLKIICALLSPRMYLSYVFKTSFKYGPVGVDTFEIYQKSKFNYLVASIFKASILTLFIHFQIIFIACFWIRIKSLKIILRTERLSIYSLYTDVLLAKTIVPTMDSMITEPSQQNYKKLNSIGLLVLEVFQQSYRDVPYLLLMLFIFCTMPWRINHLIQTIKDMRQDSTERKSFFKLLRNIFKDYACIFMNILLLLSGFKTKKALFLIRRNYRLNFFIGFLEYSYFQELVNEIKNLGVIYKSIFFMIISILFGWTRTHQMARELQALRKKKKEEEQSAASNKKLYEDTVKSGKELQTLHKMGYFNYITVCSFLTLPEIMKLRQVDQFNYMMTQRQEIWFMKWQFIYSKKSNQIAESFELKCKNAFLKSKIQFAGQIVTYDHIIMKHFRDNVFNNHVDLAIFLRDKMPIQYYDMIFKNYEYIVHEGYGPQNELPQAEHEDQQFLRLTNQVRRPKVYLTELKAWAHLLYFRANERIAQKLHRYFRQDENRRRKQLLILLLIGCSIVSYLAFIWIFSSSIFCIDSFIGVKILFIAYFHSFMGLLINRCTYLLPQWTSLIPFDLYYDAVKFKNYLIEQVKNKVIFPVKNFLIACWKFISSLAKKIYIKLAEKGEQFYQKLKIIGAKIKSGAEKVKDVTIKYSVIAYEKVVKPLYISIADKIRKLRDFIVFVISTVLKSIKSLLIFLGKLISSFYQAIRAIFKNINELYFFILQASMTFLLRFGLLGNLAFTLLGLLIMTLPSIIWLTFYRERWYLIVSTIHTMVLIVVGYKHLNKIRTSNN